MADLERAGEHCARLTRSLLAFSRHSPQPVRLIRLDKLFQEVKELLGPLVPASIDFAMEMPEPELHIVADPIQLQQVIINLVVNARDAMPEGGELEITTSEHHIDASGARDLGLELAGDYIEIAVRDGGVGMDESIQARIFDPFFTTKDQGKGTGLGLAMIYGIVREAGGVVNVQSEPGTGTTFRIVIPKAIPQARDIIALDSGEVPKGDETILVVEDEAPVRRIVIRILEQKGYRVLEAKDGISALDVCSNHSGTIDALITDVVMPRLGGLPLAKQLLETSPNLKILFHSGYSADSIDLPGSRFIQKPFAEDDLLQVVRELLDS
jgi:CheY-like chemotaxis protein